MKFLLFGTGEYYNRFKIWFEKKDVAALIDNSRDKQGEYIDDILVISPQDIFQYNFDAIIILSFYVKEMRIQLLNLGVREDKIYHFFDLNNLIYRSFAKRKIYFYGVEDREGQKDDGGLKVLLLSQDLTLGGPAIALYHAAQILVKRGCQVVYASMLDGPLRKFLTREGIGVIIDENLMIATMEEALWIRGYSFIICNTMNFHVFLSEKKTDIPVAWWLHDALFFYEGVRQEVMDKIETTNMKIWGVGPIAVRAVKSFRPDFHVEDLLYGVADKGERGKICSENKKICFTIIGYIEYRKGQDILLEAILKLEPDIRQKAEFFFVGQDTSRIAKEIAEAARIIPEIILTGTVDREEIERILTRTNVLVCASREDPMPTVVAEAMMHSVPCLISNSTGTAAYIEDGINGRIFESENAKQLKELVEGCILGDYDLEKMGKNARKIFEKYFSMEAFEKRFMSLVEEVGF